MTIGEMIKLKREALGMTQQELAEKLYVSRLSFAVGSFFMGYYREENGTGA